MNGRKWREAAGQSESNGFCVNGHESSRFLQVRKSYGHEVAPMHVTKAHKEVEEKLHLILKSTLHM
jgi:hypothetical protein